MANPVRIHPQGAPPKTAEVATVYKAEFLQALSIEEYPNFSQIIQHRAEGRGVAFYDTMLGTDPDLEGFFVDLADDVLHYPWVIRKASDSAEHGRHARFAAFALRQIPHHQNALRHFLEAPPRGFSVSERIYDVVTRGEWTGAVYLRDVLDKPQRWFTFDPQRRLRLRTAENAQPGELLDQEKFIVITYGTNSNPWGTPILDSCYWAWFLKHQALRNQATFMEKWAQPLPIAKYKWDQDEQTNRANKEKALKIALSAQSDQAIALPEGMELTLLESARNGSISYKEYIDQLTETESRRITGQILTTGGEEGGSYALGKVHERKEKNKVVMIAKFLSAQVSRQIIRDLIDRNFGPQDAYPRFEIVALSASERASEANVEAALMKNGHRLSRSWSAMRLQLVEPEDENDVLTPPPELINQQQPAVPATLARGRDAVKLAGAVPRELYGQAQEKAASLEKQLQTIGAKATKQAKPAMVKIIRALAQFIRKKKRLERISRADLFRALENAPTDPLGRVFDVMLDRPEKVAVGKLAEGEEKSSAISTAAKLALALQLLAIVDRVWSAVEDGRDEDLSPEDLAESLTDADGLDVPGHFGRLFDAIHETNIASVQAARLRRLLESESFRARYPYVMLVATDASARPGHRALDGYIMSSDDARYSRHFPPFDFGCRCHAVPISAEMAKKYGLTGRNPVGTVEQFLQTSGATRLPISGEWTIAGERFFPGRVPGFSPSFDGIDTYVQLQALRQKAEELRRTDPSAWAALHALLLSLFAFDILQEDPKEIEDTGIEEALDEAL